MTAPTATAQIRYVAVVETDVDEQSGAAAALNRAEVRLMTAELRNAAIKNLPQEKYKIMTSETVMAQGSAKLEECSEENCVIALGNMIGADFIVRGIVSKLGTSLTMSVEMYETEDGNLVATSGVVQSEKAAELLAKTAAACAEMYKSFVNTQNSVRKAPTTPAIQAMPATYKVTAVANPVNGGHVSRNPDKTAYNDGELLTLTAIAYDGYAFIGWSGSSNSVKATLTAPIDRDLMLMANFQYIQTPEKLEPQPVMPKPDAGITQNPPDKKHNTITAGSLDVVGTGDSNGGGRTKTKGAVTSAGGIGGHWGFDYSMNMKDRMDVMMGDFNLSYFGYGRLSKKHGFHDHDPDDPYDPDDPSDPGDPGDIPNLVIQDARYIKMYCSDWKRSALNFGGKIFVDVIPYIETIELSFNFGVWQYNTVVSYLDVDAIDVDAASGVFKLPKAKDLPYDSIPLTLKEYDMNYFGLDGTPYAKLQLDASVRKTVYEWWRVKFNAGVGLSVHFATPLLNMGLIEAVQEDEGIATAEGLVQRFMDDADGIGEKILEKFLEESFSPKFGAHIAAGARLNLSLIGLYVDGKLLIPLSKYDENRQVRSLGILLNTGLYFPF
jgi:hypothetical protein